MELKSFINTKLVTRLHFNDVILSAMVGALRFEGRENDSLPYSKPQKYTQHCEVLFHI